MGISLSSIGLAIASKSADPMAKQGPLYALVVSLEEHHRQESQVVVA